MTKGIELQDRRIAAKLSLTQTQVCRPLTVSARHTSRMGRPQMNSICAPSVSSMKSVAEMIASTPS